jgi:cytochrome c-type biogenesis protein CcmH
MTPDKINDMVDRLAARLKDNPDDLAGWARLARAYKVQNRLNEAAAAYAKTGKLLDSDPDLLTQYADTLAMRNNSLQGQPSELINKALAIAPKHPMALMMAGQAAYQSGNYATAIAHWKNVLSVLPVNSPDVELIKTEIADAQLKMRGSGKP